MPATVSTLNTGKLASPTRTFTVSEEKHAQKNKKAQKLTDEKDSLCFYFFNPLNYVPEVD